MKYSLESFEWNGCKLSCNTNIKIDFLHLWYEKSIKLDNDTYDLPIKNVTHRVTLVDNKTAVVDFGTVDCEKLFDLFDTLRNAGVSKIIIGSVYE